MMRLFVMGLLVMRLQGLWLVHRRPLVLMLLQRPVHLVDAIPGVVEGGLDSSHPVTDLCDQARLKVGQSGFQGFKLGAIPGGLPTSTGSTLRSCFALEPLRSWFALLTLKALNTRGALPTLRALLSLRTRFTREALRALRTLLTGGASLQLSEGGCDLLADHVPDLSPDVFQNLLVCFPRGGTGRQTQTHQDYQ